MKRFHFRIKKKINEVFLIEPNNLGFDFLTIYFKKITHYLKTVPFIFIIPLTGILTLLLYLIFGEKILVNLVTILQNGY